MTNGLMSELICVVCAYTGHISWDSARPNRRAITMSTHIQLYANDPARFTCTKCGTAQPLTMPGST
jgi:hypothetical protein